MPPKKTGGQTAAQDAGKTLSKLAEIYGHPPKEDEVNKETDPDPTILTKFSQLKSGLTPTSAGQVQTQAEGKKIKQLERYQRRRFRG